MFNLEKSIAEWRRQMLAAGIKAPVPLEELESHLRDEIERHGQRGLNPQQVFEAAVQKMGQPGTLKMEFKKIDEKTESWEQRLLRIYFIIFPIFYSVLCCRGLLRIEMTATERILGFIAMALTAASFWIAPYLGRHLPILRSKKLRMTIQIGSLLSWLICGGLFMNFVLPRLDLTVSQLTVTVLWLMMPTAVISSIGYGLNNAARRESTTFAS